jgi:nickel transport protein
MFQRSCLYLAAAVACFASSALAHTVWLEPLDARAGEYRVVFGGHAGKIESYKPEKLKTVEAVDAQGKKLAVTQTVAADGVHVHVDGPAAMITMHFENGIFTNTGTGPTIEKPMNEVPNAKSANYTVKYNKTIVAWSPLVTKAVNQPFEVVPLDATKPVSGKPMRVLVLQDGKPAPGIKLGRGEEGKVDDPVTGADGIAAFVPVKGANKLWAGKRMAVENNPKYTASSYEYVLGFNAD